MLFYIYIFLHLFFVRLVEYGIKIREKEMRLNDVRSYYKKKITLEFPAKEK